MLYDSSGRLISEENPSSEKLILGTQNYAKYMQKTHSGRYANYGDFNEFPMYFVYPGSHGRLSYSELRSLYETSSSIRPAVDSITREVYGTDWRVVHKDLKHHNNQAEEVITRFFNCINFDNQDIGSVLSEFLNDLLVIGKGAIQKPRNKFGQLLEVKACDAAVFFPVIDTESGMLAGYREMLPPGSKRTHKIHSKDDIIFKNFATVTYTLSPIPIIETIINEISLLMLTVKNIGSAFSNDDIPPGVLHLGNIGTEPLERAKAAFKETKDISQRGFSMKVLDNVDKVNWVQFTRPFREMQLAELVPIVERIVARNFGLAAVDAGLEGGGRTSATIGQSSARAKMFIPLTKLVKNIVDNEILAEIAPKLQFIFNSTENNDVEVEKNLMSKVRLGLISINEFRLKTGDKPIQGGDRRFVLLGNEFVPLDPITGLPQYRLDLFGPGRPKNPEEGNNEKPGEKENNTTVPGAEDVIE